jgi:hypothetical protein
MVNVLRRILQLGNERCQFWGFRGNRADDEAASIVPCQDGAKGHPSIVARVPKRVIATSCEMNAPQDDPKPSG